MRHLVQGNEF